MRKCVLLLVTLQVIAVSCSQKATEPEVSPDAVPPQAINNLGVVSVTPSRVTLRWIVPGDGGRSYGPYCWDGRYSTSPLTESSWKDGRSWENTWQSDWPGHWWPAVTRPGDTTEFTVTHLHNNTTYYFAIRSAYSSESWSAISNVVSVTIAVSNFEEVGCVPFDKDGWLLTSDGSFLYAILPLHEDGWYPVRQMRAYDLRYLPSWKIVPMLRLGGLASAVAKNGLVFVLSGSLYNLSNHSSDLLILRAPPAVPEILAESLLTAGPDGGIGGHAVYGHNLYIACIDSIAVWNVSTPERPVHKGTFYSPQGLRISALRISDHVMIAFSGNATTIGLLDIADPDSIKMISVCDAGAGVRDVEVAGTTLCVLLNTNELRLIDITNPQSPVLGGSLLLPPNLRSMAVQGDDFYFSDGEQLYTASVADRLSPAIVDSCDIPVRPTDVLADSQYVYVADGEGDITILRRSER